MSPTRIACTAAAPNPPPIATNTRNPVKPDLPVKLRLRRKLCPAIDTAFGHLLVYAALYLQCQRRLKHHVVKDRCTKGIIKIS